MCGIFGFASTVENDRMHQLMIHLGLYNENRGRQSWGVAYLDDSGVVKVDKDIGEISKNLYHIPRMQKGILIGHTRAATVGSVSRDNAHPFTFNTKKISVTGVHNGGLSNHHELDTKYKRNYAVDSMHIFAHIAENRDMKEICGSGTIVFFKNKKLWLSRFNGGSLSVARLKDGHGFVWSSEEKALETALEGADLDFSMVKIENNHLYYFEPETSTLWDSAERLIIGARYVQPSAQNSQQGYFGNLRNRVRQRFVKLKIVKECQKHDDKDKDIHNSNADAIMADIETIKREIFHDPTLSYIDSKDDDKKFFCESCKAETRRRRTQHPHKDDPVCLTCLAWEVYGTRVMNGASS